MRFGIGLAALGRPGYITAGHDRDIPDRSESGMQARTFTMLDAAWDAGLRFVDVARGYGKAEEFLGAWFAMHPERRQAVTVESKWGYEYTANWQVHAEQHERKNHSLAAFERQWLESEAALGGAPDIMLVHSVTPESPIFEDRVLLDRLDEVAGCGIRVGLSTSGPYQADVLERAMRIGSFSAAQVTWNVFERSATDAIRRASDAGWTVVIKEALANGAVLERGLDSEHAPDAAALAAALAVDERATVLLGAVTSAQLESNLRALELDGASIMEATRGEALDSHEYWQQRSARAWR